MQIKPRSEKEKGGTICLPLVKNVPTPKAKDWKKVKCPICGSECWESDLARQIIKQVDAAVCTECALKAGTRGRINENDSNHKL